MTTIMAVERQIKSEEGGWLFDNAGDEVVVVGLSNFCTVKGAGNQRLMRSKVVDEDFAVDLGGVEDGAALPEEIGFFGLALDQEVDFAADPLGLFAGADFLLELHQLAAARLDGALRDLAGGGHVEGGRAFFVGVAEDAEPVDLGGLDEVAE